MLLIPVVDCVDRRLRQLGQLVLRVAEVHPLKGAVGGSGVDLLRRPLVVGLHLVMQVVDLRVGPPRLEAVRDGRNEYPNDDGADASLLPGVREAGVEAGERVGVFPQVVRVYVVERPEHLQEFVAAVERGVELPHYVVKRRCGRMRPSLADALDDWLGDLAAVDAPGVFMHIECPLQLERAVADRDDVKLHFYHVIRGN